VVDVAAMAGNNIEDVVKRLSTPETGKSLSLPAPNAPSTLHPVASLGILTPF